MDITGRQERKESERQRKETEARLAETQEKAAQQKKRLDAERIRLLRARSSRSLFDTIDSSTGEGTLSRRSSLLG